MLPAILSVTLSRGAHRLAKGGVISRRHSAIENLGSMDLLCTDKTGTPTEGRVTLAHAMGPDGKGADARVLALAAVNARLQHGVANALDDALLAAAPAKATPPRLGEVPYDFQRRRLSVVVAEGHGARLVTKGAVASMLPCCKLSPEEMAAHLVRVEAWGPRASAFWRWPAARLPAARPIPRRMRRGWCWRGSFCSPTRCAPTPARR